MTILYMSLKKMIIDKYFATIVINCIAHSTRYEEMTNAEHKKCIFFRVNSRFMRLEKLQKSEMTSVAARKILAIF